MFPTRVAALFVCLSSSFILNAADHSVARQWDEEILAAIRLDTPHPPVHARNLFHFSVAMYDAWTAYDTNSVGYLYHGKATANDIAAARREAVSYAAWRMLRERYALSRSATNTLPRLDAKLASLGYDTNNTSIDPSTPAGVGNLVALTVSNYFILDGARQLQLFKDLPPGEGGYAAFNPPLVTGTNGTLVVGYVPGLDIWGVNRWQPLAITNALDQTGYPASAVQAFLGSHWINVRPFALSRLDSTKPWIDPGPQPRFNQIGDAQFRADVVDLIAKSSHLTPDDTNMINISPGAFGNNSLGANDGTGHPLNPYTGQPYASNVVKRADFARVLAEYWADGPNSETPPGHWNSVANYIADHPLLVKRIGGVGPVVDDLEWDVKVYFALNASVHDAACTAWSIKRYYDGGRPIEYIRFMAQNGQSSNTNMPSYSPDGLPLIPNLIELVTPFTSQAGQKHAGIPAGEIAVRSWAGEPDDRTNNYAGVKWIWGEMWMPYQRKTFVSPAFPGYFSGHSTFSRAAAEVLTAITGSPFFPGGMGGFIAQSNTFLLTEKGPSQTVEFQWATYYDAADHAGLSRLYGGIHPQSDDFPGRVCGSECGLGVWNLARQYFDGSILSNTVQLAMTSVNPEQVELRYQTLRGFHYTLQSTTDLTQPFADELEGSFQATNTWWMRVDEMLPGGKYYRVVRSLAP